MHKYYGRSPFSFTQMNKYEPYTGYNTSQYREEREVSIKNGASRVQTCFPLIAGAVGLLMVVYCSERLNKSNNMMD
jgi:hypothetical protein